MLPKPLSAGDFVEVAFETASGAVQGMAEMLTSNQATSGWKQAFRFVALSDNDHQNLRRAVETSTDRGFLDLKSRSTAAGQAY